MIKTIQLIFNFLHALYVKYEPKTPENLRKRMGDLAYEKALIMDIESLFAKGEKLYLPEKDRFILMSKTMYKMSFELSLTKEDKTYSTTDGKTQFSCTQHVIDSSKKSAIRSRKHFADKYGIDIHEVFYNEPASAAPY